MYRIVGKANLAAINAAADTSIGILTDLLKVSSNPDITKVAISIDDLEQLASGYLYLYNKVLEHGIMPANSNNKHKVENIH